MTQNRQLYTHGKLLITAEYAVLDGALALALPTQLGQHFNFATQLREGIHWVAKDLHQKIWFEGQFDAEHLIAATRNETADRLTQIFQAIRHLNPQALRSGLFIESTLEFERKWGLGTSSTLISALASYFDLDPYILLEKTFGGSGYDIACADAEGPICYRRSEAGVWVEPIDLNWPFRDELHLIYLNQKMDSRKAINHYKQRGLESSLIDEISALTKAVIQAQELEDFERLMQKHEHLIGTQLELDPIGQTLFKGLSGTFISLGGWGGDFALFTRKENIPSLKEKGYHTILKLSELCVL
jgi:mevalonate kinase